MIITKKFSKLKHRRASKWKEDVEFYQGIWDRRPLKTCEVTGKWLGKEPLSTFFHHVLSKNKFPQYRWCEWNIMLLHPDVHLQAERDLDKVPKVRERTEELLQKHSEGKLKECAFLHTS